MSLEITIEGIDRAIASMKEVLDGLGGKDSARAIAGALNKSLSAGRKNAAKEARKAYTAPIKKLFDNIKLQRARASNLEGSLELSGKPGVSLYHFKAQPDTPATHPKAGVSVQIFRKGSRYVKRSERGGSLPFIMKKKQGGFGVFVRHVKKDKDGNSKDAFEMLLGPSPIQAIQKAEAQERVTRTIEENFLPTLRQEIDRYLSASFGR